MPVFRVREPATVPYVLPGTVGFLGSQGSLTPVADPSGTIQMGPGTYEGIFFQDGIYASGAGNYVIRNCILEGTQDAWMCFAYDANLGPNSTILFEDCTLRWRAGDPYEGFQVGSGNITNLGVALQLSVIRCDLSGFTGGVQAAAPISPQPGIILIEDCWVHDQVYFGTVPNNTHGEAVFVYSGDVEIRGCYLDFHAVSPYTTACIFYQGAEVESGYVHHNFLNGGSFQYTAEAGAHTVEHNVFGNAYLYGRHSFSGTATVASWTGNVDTNGNPIAAP